MSESSLSAAYAQAQALVDNFSLTGMPQVSPQWAPPVQAGHPSQPAPSRPPSWVEPMNRAISQRVHRLDRMLAHREVLRAILLRIREHDHYEDDLIDLTRESQAAQVGALITCASLIVALPSHVEGDPRAAQILASHLDAVRSRLSTGLARLSRTISKIPRTSGDAAAALAALQAVIEESSAALSKLHSFAGLMEWLQTTGDQVLQAIKLIEALDEARDKDNLLFAAKVFQDYLVDVLKDAAVSAGSDALLALGRQGAAHTLSLASFVVDYAYNTGRFYVAWNGVHQTLAQMEDSTRLAATISSQITETTDQIRSTRAELERMKAAQATGAGAQQLIQEISAKERQEAYRQGEWFSRNTGFAAPGGPIFQGGDE